MVPFATPASGVTVIAPEATMVALPLPRLSACMAPDSIPLKVTIVPCVKFTLALWGAPPSSTIAYRAKSLAVPLKLIVVFVAVMVALPLDCIRSPVWLLPVGLLLLRMVTPSAVIVMGALVAVGPVVLAALTALTPGEPAGMVTLTPG